MITLVLADRSRPLLGAVSPVFEPHINELCLSPEQVDAVFVPSPLGEAIVEHWRIMSFYAPEIKPLYLQLMEEHLHAILQVVKPMDRPLGNAVGGFKTWCNKFYRETTGIDTNLFAKGFQDSILFGEGQLARMFNYLHDNPRRLAIRRLFPDFFTTLNDLELDGQMYNAFGNRFLLKKSLFWQLQISRTVTPETMYQKQQEMHQAIMRGAVVVSPCISPGEKILMREAMDVRASLIALKNNGFPKCYKPSGKFFDACAEGRLLMLAPKAWGYRYNPIITREQCCELNALAERIAGGV